MRVAIDGPAGSGKSTVARAVAARCGLSYLDTGAMYRAVTWKCLSDGVPVESAEAVTRLARTIKIEFGFDERGQTVCVDGDDVTAAIRTPGVDRNVSAVAALPAVREAMVDRQRVLGAQGDVVAEGRDIGTVVFPDAEVKVFLTADAAARAHRRAVQRGGQDAAIDANAQADAEEEKKVLDDILRRDKLDSTRDVAPLRPAEDATHIDSSTLTVDEVVDKIVALIDAARDTGKQAEASDEGKDEVAEQPTAAPEPAAKAEPKAEPEPASKPAAADKPKPAPKPKKDEPEDKKMRAFAGNSFDDYRDNAMANYPRPAKLFTGFVVGLLGGVTKVIWPWKIEDAEKLWVKSPGRVIIMNHVSMLEPVMVYVTLYTHGIRPRFVYKSEFDKILPLSFLLSRVGGIPVDRGTADLKAIRRAERAIKRGEFVVIYPEGTRIRTDDQKVDIHGGFALIAQLGRAPVQPSAVVGARDITPNGTHLKRLFWRVYAKAGDPIGFDQVEGKGRKAKCAAMEKLAMEKVYVLRDELRAAHPNKN